MIIIRRALMAVVVSACALVGTPVHAATPPAHRAMKGVSAWSFRGVDQALNASHAAWFYTWGADPGGIHGRAAFVPMVWGPGSVTASSLRTARSESTVLLTFNEPDRGDQADMTPAQALALWPRLQRTGMTLVSPAVSTGADRAGGWLDRFVAGVRRHHYRLGPIALHWYGSDFRTGPAVSQLRDYLVDTHRRYGKPIWLTEFALIRWDATGAHYPSTAALARFVTAAVHMLDALPWLQRYAWFALPTFDGGGTGLYRPGAVPTAAGRAFARA